MRPVNVASPSHTIETDPTTHEIPGSILIRKISSLRTVPRLQRVLRPAFRCAIHRVLDCTERHGTCGGTMNSDTVIRACPLFPSSKLGETSIPDGTTVLEQATRTTRADQAEILDRCRFLVRHPSLRFSCFTGFLTFGSSLFGARLVSLLCRDPVPV